jgi:uncharacterized membrane protein
MVVGLLLRYRSLQMVPRKVWQRAILWVSMILATAIIARVAVPIIATSEPASVFEGMVNVLYPIADLAIAIGALLIALMMFGGALSVPWGLIAAGCFCVAISDLLYASAV